MGGGKELTKEWISAIAIMTLWGGEGEANGEIAIITGSAELG